MREETKFKYLDYVRVTSGFYRGWKGNIIEYQKYPGEWFSDTPFYYIVLLEVDNSKVKIEADELEAAAI